MTKLSVLILTKDEEINIAGCIASVAWCDDIVVLDSGSKDRTVEIARDLGARIVTRPFDNWSAHQNWSVRNIDFKHPWVFNLDADERVDEELARDLARAVADPGENVAFRMRRKDYFRSVWLKHATFYPTWFTRLYRPEKIHFERLINPVTVADGPIGSLQGHILHWPFSKGIVHWVERHNSYSGFEAQEAMKREEFKPGNLWASDAAVRRRAAKALFYRLPGRPLIKFFYLYLFHFGFLDGRSGFDYAALTSFYEYMIVLKVRELKKGVTEGVPTKTIAAIPSEEGKR
jgi:glycosyltransferase involved in cell wall biosynthesis